MGFTITLYAIWKAKTAPPVTTYIVTFDASGGTGTMAPASGVSGAYTLPACGFTAPTDKEFKAWSIGGVEYNPGDSITVSGNITVTALWKDKQITPPTPTTYTVRFDANGGSVSPASMTTGTDGKLASLPTPTRSSCKTTMYFRRGTTMPKQEILKKTTERKMGKVTYLVSAAPSERATEPIEKKLVKMIRKEVVQSAENAAV